MNNQHFFFFFFFFFFLKNKKTNFRPSVLKVTKRDGSMALNENRNYVKNVF